MKWQNGFLGVSKAAALGWARGPGKRSERRSRLKAICPHAMRSFWKVAAFRLTGSIRIQSGRRALRCFQNELHHFIILNRKWYKTPSVTGISLPQDIHFLEGGQPERPFWQAGQRKTSVITVF